MSLGSAAPVLGLATLVVVVASFPAAQSRPLPWRTFSEASAYAARIGVVACPGNPEDIVLRVTLKYGGEQYVYWVRDGRWVLWLEDQWRGRVAARYVWVGSQEPSDDVMRAAMSMSSAEVQKYLHDGCAWIEGR